MLISYLPIRQELDHWMMDDNGWNASNMFGEKTRKGVILDNGVIISRGISLIDANFWTPRATWRA